MSDAVMEYIGAAPFAGGDDTCSEHSAPVPLFSSDATDWEMYRAITDYSSVTTLGHDISALDSEGGVHLWNEKWTRSRPEQAAEWGRSAHPAHTARHHPRRVRQSHPKWPSIV